MPTKNFRISKFAPFFPDSANIFGQKIFNCHKILLWSRLTIISKNLSGITDFDHVPSQLKTINTVHNKSVRALVCARKRDPLSKIYRDLKLLKLIDIYYFNLEIFAYQTFSLGCPNFFENYAVTHNVPPRYCTRSTNSSNFDFTSDAIFYNQPLLYSRYSI